MNPPSLDRNLASNFLTFLYGRQSGWACLAIMNLENGWQQEFFNWPADRNKMLELAMQKANTPDVYIGMLLYREKFRRKLTALSGSVLWSDVDHELSVEQHLMLEAQNAWIIESGTPGHTHVYVKCSETLERSEIEKFNTGLAKTLGGDAKWSADTVLRLPGTLNHKRPGRPRPVRSYGS